MKIIMVVIMLLTFASCNKDRKCYHCTFGTYNGVMPPPLDCCGDDGGTRRFQDADGNDINSYCVEK